MNSCKRKTVRLEILAAVSFALWSAAPRAQNLPNPLPDAPLPAQSTGQPQAKAPAIQAAPTAHEQDGLGRADVTFWGTPRRVLFDEKEMLTSPARLRIADSHWLLPFAAATGALIGTDAHSMTLEHLNANDQKRASKITDGTVGILGALPAGMYLWSTVIDAPLARETGLLTGESLADALVLSEAGKAVFRRDSPLTGNGRGDFFKSSFSDASFPSNHATAAWAMAAVIGDEYPGWFSRTVVYTLAGTTSIGRIVAEKHFPSDVLVGSALGWLVGHYVYRTHHHYELTPYEDPPVARDSSSPASQPRPVAVKPAVAIHASASVVPAATTRAQVAQTPQRLSPEDIGEMDPDTIGSTNVPMDSWVYPALERLAAMGFIPSQSVAIRPWTRVECARQVAEASDLAAGYDPDDRTLSKSEANEAEGLLEALRREFGDGVKANESLGLESVYTRYGTIAGPALADSYHFGQTWWNDFGRPLGRGGSALLGFSMHATAGRSFFYAREEVQHGPGKPANPAGVDQLVASLDANPEEKSFATPSYTRFRSIELYAGVAFDGNALSLGKQELFWGPTTMGPLAFSSNAEPTYSLRFVSTRPHPLPFFSNLGTFRFDIVIGKLSGHAWPERPWYNGQKIDFNLGQNLELSFTRWSLLWGVGHPITLGGLIKNLDSFSSSVASSDYYGNRLDPGDRKSNFDFRYRLPWLRREVTLYADAFSDDDPSPMDAPRRAVWNPGIYFARLPWLQHMDFRVEAVSSLGLASDFGGQHFFYNNQYHDANTNKGFMLGNAIGRDSRAEEGRLGWWVSAQTRVEAGYRQSKGGTLFLPGGSTISDGFVNARVQMGHHWNADLFGQYERFLIPSYMAGVRSNKSGWLQLTWTPEAEARR
jgi:membrane-associated phospholipid phosphatase